MPAHIEVSIVIPTYREAKNIPKVAQSVARAMNDAQHSYEIIFVDDNSRDGSERICLALTKELPVRMIVRKQDKGLSTAVLRGIEEARGDYIVVMDADLSHPAKNVSEMLQRLSNGENDFVIGSRYIHGGSLDESWGLLRRLNSRIATLLALPLTHIHDPMSGFFAFRRSHMPENNILSPIGYKIGLELLVKGEFRKPGEVPIHFIDRQHGESKLTWQEQIRYLRHLRRLYQFKFPFLSEFFQFGLVGASGFVVDLALYLGLQTVFGMSHILARALSFWGAASSNWALNRLLTFSDRKKTSKLVQWPAFVMSSLFGFGINWGTYYMLTQYVPYFQEHLIYALMVGVLMGLGFNFTFARLFVFIPYEEEIEASDKRSWQMISKHKKN